MTTTPVVHDHFVLLLDKDQFENPPSWLTENFNIIEGGTHTGGSSRNKLIVFKDGTYLELFNWISKPAEFLAWADKRPGLIDFALTTLDPVTPEHNFNNILTGLSRIPPGTNIGVRYLEPSPGARKCADGTEVKWKSSRPEFSRTDATPDEAYFPNGRIDAPFFCHDVTDRKIRVAYDDSKITTHPCGAVGIDSIKILVPESHIDAYIQLYGAILGVEKPNWFLDEYHDEGAFFKINVPHPVDSAPSYVAIYPTRHYQVTYSSASPDNPPDPEAEDQAFLRERGIGIKSLTLRTAERTTDGHNIGQLGDDEIGRTIKLLGWLGRPNAKS